MGLIRKFGILVVIILVLGFAFIDFSSENYVGELTGMFGTALLEEDEPNYELYFCPEDSCKEQLISQIDSAEESIRIAIYSFTLDDVSDALIRAKKRGVSVKVIFDYTQASNEYSEDEKIREAGISMKIKRASGYMHNKFTIIDEKKVLTGSFNYSKNADTKNDENLIIIFSEKVAKQYFLEFEELWEESD